MAETTPSSSLHRRRRQHRMPLPRSTLPLVSRARFRCLVGECVKLCPSGVGAGNAPAVAQGEGMAHLVFSSLSSLSSPLAHLVVAEEKKISTGRPLRDHVPGPPLALRCSPRGPPGSGGSRRSARGPSASVRRPGEAARPLVRAGPGLALFGGGGGDLFFFGGGRFLLLVSSASSASSSCVAVRGACLRGAGRREEGRRTGPRRGHVAPRRRRGRAEGGGGGSGGKQRKR